MEKFFPHATLAEAEIAAHLILTAIDKGWLVTVSDGEDIVINKSNAFDDIAKVMNTTDTDILTFTEVAPGREIGRVVLIWGNGRDLISDYTTDQNGFDRFMDSVFDFAEQQ